MDSKKSSPKTSATKTPATKSPPTISPATKSTETKSTPKPSAAKATPKPDALKVQGPASYFPSIEKTYGQPVDHWFSILAGAGESKHMEYVALLKTEHGIGHGHANALVAHWLTNR
jgi:Domain of unknown function (DUF4287)